MTQRYFFKLAYNGTGRSGWQKQPNAPTIQEDIESLFSSLYQDPVEIVGCGRTDAGVHASSYYFHADIPTHITTDSLLYKLNRMSEAHLAFHQIISVVPEAHARFDAFQRSYNYNVSLEKNPFGFSHQIPSRKNFNFEKLNEAAAILLDYIEFFPLCKSNSEVKNYRCQVSQSKWEKLDDNNYVYHVTSNRFLRGMVRLIVGMCLNHMNGLIDLDEIHDAMINQRRFNKDLSVPPDGLFLNEILYPEKLFLSSKV